MAKLKYILYNSNITNTLSKDIVKLKKTSKSLSNLINLLKYKSFP